jgi:hypothetical protein
MKAIAIVLASFCLTTAAIAQTGADAGGSCKTQAAGKNLHGAALTSTVKSCCKQQAAAQKLHGAAETSFLKSCQSAGLGT